MVACVSLVIIGGLVMYCEKCWGLLAKRDDDDDDDDDEKEKYRRKLYKKARKAFGHPSVRPMYM